MPKNNLPAPARLFTPVTLAALLALGGCGQKGPLYMPQDPAAPAPPHAHGAGHTAASGAGEGKTEEKTDKKNELPPVRRTSAGGAGSSVEPGVTPSIEQSLEPTEEK